MASRLLDQLEEVVELRPTSEVARLIKVGEEG